jgi:hypothetical protein
MESQGESSLTGGVSLRSRGSGARLLEWRGGLERVRAAVPTPVGARTCRFAVALAVVLVLACERRSPPRPDRHAPPRQSVASAMSPIADAGTTAPPPTPSVVVRQRETRLEIPARRDDAQRMAFSRRRLAVLGEERLVVWDLANWQLVTSVPVQQPRRLTVMADGAFVVAAGRGTLRLEQHETQPAVLPRLLLLPNSHLWADRRSALTLWVPVGRTLNQYQFPQPDEPPAARLVPVAGHPLRDCDEHGFVGLKDGSFLFTAGGKLTRFFPEGKSMRGPSPVSSEDTWRLLPARRIDRAWLATVDGHLRLLISTETSPSSVRYSPSRRRSTSPSKTNTSR